MHLARRRKTALLKAAQVRGCRLDKELTMCEIAMTIPDESLAAQAESPEEASAELRMLAAVKLFEMKKLSSGAAAPPAGFSPIWVSSRPRQNSPPAIATPPRSAIPT